MSRNFVLVFGAICWAGLGLDAAVQLISGNLVFPVAVGLAFALWVVVFQHHYGHAPVPAEVPVEA